MKKALPLFDWAQPSLGHDLKPIKIKKHPNIFIGDMDWFIIIHADIEAKTASIDRIIAAGAGVVLF